MSPQSSQPWAESKQLQSKSASSIWQNEAACAFPLLVLLIDRFGPEALAWTPMTIVMEIEVEFNVQVSRENFDKLMAAIHILNSNSFYKSLPDFIAFCLALCGEQDQIADSWDIAWGMTEGMLINPPDKKDENPFTDEIRSYIGYILDRDGILVPPDVLRLGTRDKGDLAAMLKHDYAEDPEMYEAIFKTEKEKTDNINKMIHTKMLSLLQQLKSLSLNNGDVQIAEKLLINLNKMHQT
jgi:hypothetical protein